jgi:hypothetical protein
MCETESRLTTALLELARRASSENALTASGGRCQYQAIEQHGETGGKRDKLEIARPSSVFSTSSSEYSSLLSTSPAGVAGRERLVAITEETAALPMQTVSRLLRYIRSEHEPGGPALRFGGMMSRYGMAAESSY